MTKNFDTDAKPPKMNFPITILAVALCGALGALSRYAISHWLSGICGDFPLGTLAVNLIGCLLLGFFFFYPSDRSIVSPELRVAIMTGFLGAFTTFSTFGVETYDHAQRGNFQIAIMNIGCSILAGLFAVWLGHGLATWLAGWLAST